MLNLRVRYQPELSLYVGAGDESGSFVEDNITFSHAVTATYLAEGGANVIFALAVQTGAVASPERSTHSTTDKWVLRINKNQSSTSVETSKVEPSTAARIVSHVNEVIVPLLGDFVIRHQLIYISKEAVERLDQLWQANQVAASSNIKKRGGSLSSTSNDSLEQLEAILLPDMRPSAVSGAQILELKPKWLAQSPNAPAGAVRCRTCAKQASEGTHKTTMHCPLALLSGDPSLITTQLESVAIAQGINDRNVLRALINYFCTDQPGHSLLQLLASLQQRLDTTGIVLAASRKLESAQPEWSPTLLGSIPLAMTLRDCSLFLRLVPRRTSSGPHLTGLTGLAGGEAREVQTPALHDTTALRDDRLAIRESHDIEYGIEAKLADFDPKDIKKADHWFKVEQSLLNHGCYMGSEDYVGDIHDECFLWSK